MTSADSNTPEFDDLLLAVDRQLSGDGQVSDVFEQAPPALRQRVERVRDCLELLRSAENVDEVEPDSSLAAGLPPRFRVLRSLGCGGFGEVVLAIDENLGRRVAIKFPHARQLSDPLFRKRFLREAQALGRLCHPSIVSVFESGETSQTPYIVMEYCDAGNLTQLLTGHVTRPKPEACAAIVLQIAEGLDQVHQMGILHRDIKPRNILFKRKPESETSTTTDSNRKTDSTDPPWHLLEAKLSDFGLAKVTGSESDSSKTQQGGIAGTPQYMSPEQVNGRTDQIGAPTDVHGLGLVLYELLTGQQPYVGDSATETCWRIVHEEPVPIRRIRPAVPRDLETICHKALQKTPSKRYQNAGELAQDLQRFLTGTEIIARPISRIERAWKWTCQFPDRAILLLVVIVCFALLSAGGWWYSGQLSMAISLAEKATATEAQLRFEAEQRESVLIEKSNELNSAMLRERELSYAGQIRLANDLFQQGSELECLGQLQSASHRKADARDDFCWRLLSAQCGGEIRRFEAQGESTGNQVVAYLPDKDVIVAGSRGGQLFAWQANDGQRFQMTLPVLDSMSIFGGINYLPQVRRWVIAFDFPNESRRSEIVSWDEVTGQTVTWDKSDCFWNTLPSVDGQRVVSLANENESGIHTFRVYSALTGKRLWTVPAERYMGIIPAWSPEGHLAIPDDSTVKIYSVDGVLLKTLNRKAAGGCTAVYSGDGHYLALLREDFSVDLWRKAKTGFEFQQTIDTDLSATVDLDKVRHRWHGLCFCHGGQSLAFDGPDQRVYIWDIKANRLRSRSVMFENSLSSISDATDNRLLLHETRGGVYLWTPIERRAQEAGHSREAWAVDFSPNGTTLATGSDDQTIKLWDPATLRELTTLGPFDTTVTQVKFSPDGTNLAGMCIDGRLHVWDFDESRRCVAEPHRTWPLHRKGRCLSWSLDSKSIATGGYDGDVILLNPFSGEVQYRQNDHQTTVRQLLFHPSLNWLISVSNDERAVIRETPPIRSSPTVLTEEDEVHSAVALPDGLALGLKSGQIHIWDMQSGRPLYKLAGHHAPVRSMSLSPNGQLLVSGDDSGMIRAWRVENQQLLFARKLGTSPINSIAFSPQGEQLAIATHDGRITVWNAPRVR